MSPAATGERELADTDHGKGLLVDSFGVSRGFSAKEGYAWVAASRADTDMKTFLTASQSFETGQLRPPLTGPIFSYLMSRATYTENATASALDLWERAGQRCYVASEDVSESSTAPVCSKRAVLWPRDDDGVRGTEAVIDTIFRMAMGDSFEDGMSSRFSRELLEAVKKYGVRAMPEIAYLILYNRTNQEVASEALRWIGRSSGRGTYGWRLWLLEKALSSPSPVVRDGAVLGLASMGDPSAVPYLREAIGAETCQELREDMLQALEELEAAGSAAVAQKDQKV